MSDHRRKLSGTDLADRLLGANPFSEHEPNHTKWASVFLRASQKCEPVAAQFVDCVAEHGNEVDENRETLRDTYLIAFNICAEVLLDFVTDYGALDEYQQWVKGLLKRAGRAYGEQAADDEGASELSDQLNLKHLPRWLDEARMRAASSALARAFVTPIVTNEHTVSSTGNPGEPMQLPTTVKNPVSGVRRRLRSLTNREKVIRKAIRQGLRGKQYCAYLDDQSEITRETWQKNKDNPCPRRHAEAYRDPYWREMIQKEKSRVAAKVKRK